MVFLVTTQTSTEQVASVDLLAFLLLVGVGSTTSSANISGPEHQRQRSLGIVPTSGVLVTSWSAHGFLRPNGDMPSRPGARMERSTRSSRSLSAERGYGARSVRTSSSNVRHVRFPNVPSVSKTRLIPNILI